MNKVFISGMVAEAPALRMEQGEVPHLVLNLSVRHRTKDGEVRKELYRVSAWHSAARWGAENLAKGQLAGMQGYLTQRTIHADGMTAAAVEIVAEEFLPMRQALQEKDAGSCGMAACAQTM